MSECRCFDHCTRNVLAFGFWLFMCGLGVREVVEAEKMMKRPFLSIKIDNESIEWFKLESVEVVFQFEEDTYIFACEGSQRWRFP